MSVIVSMCGCVDVCLVVLSSYCGAGAGRAWLWMRGMVHVGCVCLGVIAVVVSWDTRGMAFGRGRDTGTRAARIHPHELLRNHIHTRHRHR